MPEEIKPEGQESVQPEGNADPKPPMPNQGNADEVARIKEDFEKQIKERDAKIADLETTRATIEARQRQIDEEKIKQSNDSNLQTRLAQINERRAYDPEGADREMAILLSDREKQITEAAVLKAQQTITQQTAIERLKAGVKSSNPNFDDDIVDVVMERANALAMTGKYKSAEEAVKAATDFVKSKFDNYAQKKNAMPPLPTGARAEGGGSNVLPKAPEPQIEKTPLDEINEANEAKRKKLM